MVLIAREFHNKSADQPAHMLSLISAFVICNLESKRGFNKSVTECRSGLEVIKLEFILRLKIKRNDWLFADTCPQAANHFALF